MAKIIISIIIIVIISSGSDYHPLTKKDRSSFQRDSKTIIEAYGKKNYNAIKLFGPGIVEKYESIELDPGSMDLRNTYHRIKNIVESIERIKLTDSLNSEIQGLLFKRDYAKALDVYQDYMFYLMKVTPKNVSDSLIAMHKTEYNQIVGEMFKSYPNIQTFKKVKSLRFTDSELIDSLKVRLQDIYFDDFLYISSSSDYGRLEEFKKNFEGIYDEDIENLQINIQAHMRGKAIRSGNIEYIEKYYSMFPEKDPLIEEKLEKDLFEKFYRTFDMNDAMKYLTYFPKSRRSSMVREELVTIQEKREKIKNIKSSEHE